MLALTLALVMLQGPQGPTFVEPNNVAGVFSMPGVGACPTVILTSGGTILYVCESPESVKRKFDDEQHKSTH